MGTKEKSNSRRSSKRTTSPPPMGPSSALDDKLDSGNLFQDKASFYHSWLRTKKPSSPSATTEISNDGSAKNAAKKRRDTSSESLISNLVADIDGATGDSNEDTDFDSMKSATKLFQGKNRSLSPVPVQLPTARGRCADEKKHQWQESLTSHGQPQGQVQGDAFEPSSAQPTPVSAMSKGGQLMDDKKHQRRGLSSSKMFVRSAYRETGSAHASVFSLKSGVDGFCQGLKCMFFIPSSIVGRGCQQGF